MSIEHDILENVYKLNAVHLFSKMSVVVFGCVCIWIISTTEQKFVHRDKNGYLNF